VDYAYVKMKEGKKLSEEEVDNLFRAIWFEGKEYRPVRWFSPRSEVRMQFSRTEMRIAETAQWTFSPKRVREVGRAEWRSFLNGLLMPNVYAMLRSEIRSLLPLLSNPSKIGTHMQQISLILEGVPKEGDETIGLLTDILAKSKLISVLLVIPDTSSQKLSKLNGELIQKVQKKRKIKTGVNLVVSGQVKEVIPFLSQTGGNALVCDMRKDGKNNLESLASGAVKAKRGGQVLLVYNDASLSQQAYVLLASVNTLLEQKKIGVWSALNILNSIENLEIQAIAQKVIEQAA
jgi:hypothetical protein